MHRRSRVATASDDRGQLSEDARCKDEERSGVDHHTADARQDHAPDETHSSCFQPDPGQPHRHTHEHRGQNHAPEAPKHVTRADGERIRPAALAMMAALVMAGFVALGFLPAVLSSLLVIVVAVAAIGGAGLLVA